MLHTKFFYEEEDEQHINATYSQAPKTKYDDDDDLEKNHQNFKNGTHSHTHTRDTLVNNVKSSVTLRNTRSIRRRRQGTP